MRHVAMPSGLVGALTLLGLQGCDSETNTRSRTATTTTTVGAGSGTGGATATSGDSGGPASAGASGAAGASGTPSEASCPVVDEAMLDHAPALLHPVDQYEVFVFGVVDGMAYFVEGQELRRVPVEGGSAETVGPINPSWVRMVADDRVLWVEPVDGGALSIVNAPLDDPTELTVAVAETPSVGHVLVDEDSVYWATTDPHEVHRAALSGESSELLVPEAQPLGAVLHDGYYYWLDFSSDQLERVPVTGGPREELTPILFGGPMGAADGAIFWGDTSINSIEKWSPDEGRKQLARSIDPQQIQVVDDTVFWSQGLLGGRVRAIGVDGDNERDILCNIRSRPSIVVTDDHVLVGGASGLIRVPR